MAPGEQKVESQITDAVTTNPTPLPDTHSNTSGENGTTLAKTFDIREFIKNGKRIRQERIRRVSEKYKKLGLKAHHGTISRIAMDRPLTATQFYNLQCQLPAQIAYALTDARAKLQEQEIAQAEAQTAPATT